ncbi:hypothetical protein CEE82_12850, partial [Lactobacillus crispatus]
RLEYGKRADMVAAKIASFNGNQAIYHIKGTNNWIYSIDVDPEAVLLLITELKLAALTYCLLGPPILK